MTLKSVLNIITINKESPNNMQKSPEFIGSLSL